MRFPFESQIRKILNQRAYVSESRQNTDPIPTMANSDPTVIAPGTHKIELRFGPAETLAWRAAIFERLGLPTELIQRIHQESRFAYVADVELNPSWPEWEVPLKSVSLGKFHSGNSSYPGWTFVIGQPGRIECLVRTNAEVEDLVTMRNLLEDHIRSFFAIEHLYGGRPVELSISTIWKPSGEKLDVRRTNPVLIKENQNYFLRVDPNAMVTHGSFPFFQRALIDLQSAAQRPTSTSFYVYRAIECLRQYYGQREGLDMEVQQGQQRSWEILRQELNCTKEDFDLVRKHALVTRHGGTKDTIESEQDEFIAFGWKILTRFLERTFPGNLSNYKTNERANG